MAVIGISLNDVIRSHTERILHIYQKYNDEKFLLETSEVKSTNLLDYLKFKNLDELNNFLYIEAPLEIFGHAGIIQDGIINELNQFLLDIDFDEEHEVVIVSKEVGKSIPASLFFLSKLGCKVSNIQFTSKEEDVWKNVDVLITTTPLMITSKPNGKVCIKINTPYNTQYDADYTLDSISEFFRDEKLRNKMISNKIAEFQEL